MIQIIPNWHPALVHFTIALYTTAALLFAVHVAIADGRWNGAADERPSTPPTRRDCQVIASIANSPHRDAAKGGMS